METYYPPVGFYFRVKFLDISEEIDTKFQEVSGLTVTVGTEDYVEGGQNRFVHKLPKGTTYDNLVLKRGIVKGSKLVNWCNQTMESLEIKPMDVLISLLDEKGEPLYSWDVVHAFPTKWAFEGLNAESGELLIETMELNYHYFSIKNF